MITLALGTLPPEKVTLGAGLDSLARNLGNTIGVPLITAYVTNRERARLTSYMRAQTLGQGNAQALNSLQRALENAGEPPARARMRSLNILRNQMTQRAAIESYHDGYRLAAIAGIFLIPLVLFIRTIRDAKRTPRHGGGAQSGEPGGGTSNFDQSDIKETKSGV